MLKNFKEVLEDALDNTNLFYILWAVCILLGSPTLYLALYGIIGIDETEDKVSLFLSVFFLVEMVLVYRILSSKGVRNPRILANLSLICFYILFFICRIFFQ